MSPCWYRTIVAFLSSVVLSATAHAQFDTTGTSYARYTRPGQCVRLSGRLTRSYWRDKRADTVRYAPKTDSVPASVRRAVEACAARFVPAITTSRDLLDLLDVYLQIGKVDAAHAAEAKLLALEAGRPTAERGWMLYRIFNTYLNAKPVLQADAVRVLAMLDAMPGPALPWRALVHTEIASYYISIGMISEAVNEGRIAVAANRATLRNDRIDRVGDAWMTWKGLAEATSVQSGGRAALAILDTAALELLPLLAPPPGAIGARDHELRQETLRKHISDERISYEIMGTMPSPIEATHWFTVNGDSTVRPMPHAVTLVVEIVPNCDTCFAQYATLHRLVDKYVPRGLRVVLLSQTEGAFKEHPMLQPADEVPHIRQYVHEFLKFPGILGVLETTLSFAPDGRRIDAVWGSERSYLGGRNSAIVGKDGVVRLVTKLGPARESVLDEYIEATLSVMNEPKSSQKL